MLRHEEPLLPPRPAPMDMENGVRSFARAL
jgi:hypothetical protein